MKISKLLKKKMTCSFEVFPPKTEQPIEPFLETLGKLCSLEPDFISCTYGAGGTHKGRSVEVCDNIIGSNRDVMTHFTCVGNTKEDILDVMQEYVDLGIENVLALRGDLPVGWTGTQGSFKSADRLIHYLKDNFPALCIGAGCYPEKHLEAPSMAADISHLRGKQDFGAEFFVTQMCHDVEAYEKFMDRMRKAGVTIPVIVGVLPILFKDGLIRMSLSNGCSIPAPLAEIIGKYGDDPADFKKAGKEFTVNLIHKYIESGIAGLHLYTLNKYDDIDDIIKATGLR